MYHCCNKFERLLTFMKASRMSLTDISRMFNDDLSLFNQFQTYSTSPLEMSVVESKDSKKKSSSSSESDYSSGDSSCSSSGDSSESESESGSSDSEYSGDSSDDSEVMLINDFQISFKLPVRK